MNNQSSRIRNDFNRKDWRIEGLPQVHFLVRFINAVGNSVVGERRLVDFLLSLLDIFVVGPRLRRSLREMELAEADGNIPSILCNSDARRELVERIGQLRMDLTESRSMTCFARAFTYAAVGTCLKKHRAILLRVRDNPTVVDEVIVTPVFVASFPRTGSTVLHRTMATDRARWRTLDACDQLMGTIVARDDIEGRRKLATGARKLMAFMDVLYPGWGRCLASVHDIPVDEANEDHPWYNSGLGIPFISVKALCYDEEHRRRQRNEKSGLYDNSRVAIYKLTWLRLVLQIYQRVDKKFSSPSMDSPYRPWLMKDPRHVLHLPELLSVFPDAKLIFTHRLLVNTFPSCAKLGLIMRCAHVVPGAPGTTSREVGEEILQRYHDLSRRLVEFTREKAGTDLRYFPLNAGRNEKGKSTRRVDIVYEDFVTDIPGIIAKIYKQLFPDQPEATEYALSKMRLYLKDKKSKKTLNQTSNLQQFNVTKQQIMCKEKEYNEMFLSEDAMIHH